ncbi:MAG: FAD-dependent oxidoreductase, partial [Flavobacteriales bacterium]|nr:FAD-dependent oxidoreductase [Flavobacteriales bacterium]
MSNEFDHIVVGGGISGLTKAYSLQKQGLKVLLLEKANRTGGVIHSKITECGVTELGPNSLALTPILGQLIEELGLNDQLIKANEVANK